jgi:hypothetical protein
VIRRAPRICWFRSVKSKRCHIQLVNKGINRANRVIFGNPIIQTIWKKN